MVPPWGAVWEIMSTLMPWSEMAVKISPIEKALAGNVAKGYQRHIFTVGDCCNMHVRVTSETRFSMLYTPGAIRPDRYLAARMSARSEDFTTVGRYGGAPAPRPCPRRVTSCWPTMVPPRTALMPISVLPRLWRQIMAAVRPYSGASGSARRAAALRQASERCRWGHPASDCDASRTISISQLSPSIFAGLPHQCHEHIDAQTHIGGTGGSEGTWRQPGFLSSCSGL